MFRLLGKDKKLRDAVVLQAVHLLKEDLNCYILAGTTMLNKESDHLILLGGIFRKYSQLPLIGCGLNPLRLLLVS